MQDRRSSSREQRLKAVDDVMGVRERSSNSHGWADCTDSLSEAEITAVEETAARVRLDRPKHPPHIARS